MEQHFQLPNKMGLEGLKPKDQLVYVCIRSFMNGNTMEAFPSLETISEKINCSIPTIRTSIKRLQESEYISIRKEGRKNIYVFNKLVHYEPFSREFLENKDISFETKAFLAAAQQYMVKDVEDIGKVSYGNRELAKKINMPESTIRKCNQELERKDLMTAVKNVSRDIESGCKTETKIYRLRDLGQAIIWKLQEHDEQINKNSEDISKLQEQINKQQELIDVLLKERQLDKNQFVI